MRPAGVQRTSGSEPFFRTCSRRSAYFCCPVRVYQYFRYKPDILTRLDSTKSRDRVCSVFLNTFFYGGSSAFNVYSTMVCIFTTCFCITTMLFTHTVRVCVTHDSYKVPLFPRIRVLTLLLAV